MKKPKETVLFTLTLQGKQIEGPADPSFYDVVKDGKIYSIRSYGVCKVATAETLEEAIEYIRRKSEYVIDPRDVLVKRREYVRYSTIRKGEINED